MNKIRCFFKLAPVMALILPLFASAHAIPTETFPTSSAEISTTPTEVRMHFSERLDEAASGISVLGPSGTEINKGEARHEPSQPKTLVVPISDDGKGVYTVKWSAVSSDDGHFTRGSFTFSVGKSSNDSVASSEVVKIATAPEALAMTIELLGNGIIWAALLLFAFAIRPLFRDGRFADIRRSIQSKYSIYLITGIALVLVGASLQLCLKSSDLAGLREISFFPAFQIYILTAAGFATVMRMAAVAVVLVIFLFGRRAIVAANTFTLYEGMLIAGMCAFAFFRAKISHATANPFFPEFSIAVNFVHVIEKDLWAGVMLALSFLSVSKRFRELFFAIVPRAFTLLAADFIAVSVTASYIVWLHLEGFENLFTTTWGGVFLSLLIAASLLVTLRLYHITAALLEWRWFSHLLHVSLAVEAGIALLVVYYSSVVIITSPPVPPPTRALDSFTITMLAIAAAATVFGVLLLRFTRNIRLVGDSVRASRAQRLGAVWALLVTLFGVAFLITSFANSPLSNPFKFECESDGNMWHFMQPMKAGIVTSDISKDGCMWGMGNYIYMFPDRSEYNLYRSLPHAEVSISKKDFVAGTRSVFTVSLKNSDGSPATLFVDMEKLIHVVIVSKDETVFAHIHPDDAQPLQKKEIDSSTFDVSYVFPKAGEYLVSLDYAHGLALETKQFTVLVSGAPRQNTVVQKYSSPGVFAGYDVVLTDTGLFAGEVTTLKYSIKKDGVPVTNIVPYLSAAMHISAIKNDFSAFLHTHGEVHAPGTPFPPIIVKNGQVVHSMSMMVLPPTFGPAIEAHMIFPSSGLYTIWGEFKVGNTVIPTSFTVQVQ